MKDCTIRPARSGDQPGAYYVCLKTGDFGKDGEPFYREDPDALGRIFVGPYLAYEAELSLIPRPKTRGLLVPHFASLSAAMDALAPCLEFAPSAVELLAGYLGSADSFIDRALSRYGEGS